MEQPPPQQQQRNDDDEGSLGSDNRLVEVEAKGVVDKTMSCNGECQMVAGRGRKRPKRSAR